MLHRTGNWLIRRSLVAEHAPAPPVDNEDDEELEEFSGLLSDAQATLARIREQRIAKSRELALTRGELKRLYSQLPTAGESSGQEDLRAHQDPYTELYDLEMLDCTTDQGSQQAAPSVRLADFATPLAGEGSVAAFGPPAAYARGPKEALLADAAVLGFDAVDPATIPVGPLDEIIATACFDEAQCGSSAMVGKPQLQAASTPLAARPFRVAKSRNSPYQTTEGKDKEA